MHRKPKNSCQGCNARRFAAQSPCTAIFLVCKDALRDGDQKRFPRAREKLFRQQKWITDSALCANDVGYVGFFVFFLLQHIIFEKVSGKPYILYTTLFG